MSKNCSENFKPQTFAELEVLGNWLERETESLQQEFHTKCEFVKERQATINNNENLLLQIDQAVKRLNSNVKAVEEELQHLGCTIEMCEKAIRCISALQGVHICNCRLTPKSEREVYMKMLQETDARIKQLHNAIADMEAIKRYCLNQPKPYDIIFRILDCHHETLKSAEKQMDLILDKLLIVSTNCSPLKYHRPKNQL